MDSEDQANLLAGVKVPSLPGGDFHICSIVGNRYISTIYRRSSAAVNDPPWYYETLIFEYDPSTRELGVVVHQLPGTGNVMFARKRHWQITESMMRKADAATKGKGG